MAEVNVGDAAQRRRHSRTEERVRDAAQMKHGRINGRGTCWGC